MTDEMRFIHRPDLVEKGYVSFCTNCFLSVARAKTEAGLADGEERHECSGPLFLSMDDLPKSA